MSKELIMSKETLKEKIVEIIKKELPAKLTFLTQRGVEISASKIATQITQEFEQEIERVCYEIFGEEEGHFWTQEFLNKLCPKKKTK